MPGAPLEPGKALKDGGGPYGLPGADMVGEVSIDSAVNGHGADGVGTESSYLRMDYTPSLLCSLVALSLA